VPEAQDVSDFLQAPECLVTGIGDWPGACYQNALAALVDLVDPEDLASGPGSR
jgi:hypothetical protein